MRIGASKSGLCAVLVCLGAIGTISVAAQNIPSPKAPKAPKAEVRPKKEPRTPPSAEPEMPDSLSRRGTIEKAIAVAPNVSVLIPCVTQARVTINGWQRDEIRVFIKGGTNVGFKVHEKDPKSGKPIWVVIAKSAGGASESSQCVSGDRIDIEMPLTASVKMTGRETESRIDSVKRVEIKNLGGDVSLRNISGGITASTYEGDLTVESSSGQIALDTSSGNILAFEVTPGQIGEVFKAKTSNGTITLQRVEHRQIEANSVSGALLFNGKFLPGGIYGFKTQNGSIKLAIPIESSCKVAAWYGYGTLKSEIPMKIETQDIFPGGKRVVAKIGGGMATVNLSTNGEISIVKQ